MAGAEDGRETLVETLVELSIQDARKSAMHCGVDSPFPSACELE